MRRIRDLIDRALHRRRRSGVQIDDGEEEPPVPPIVAGYRVLRTLARGERADVLLGHPGAHADGPPRAVKLFRSSTPREHIDGELVALARAQGPHVVQLVDVSTLHDGRVAAVLERVERDTLGALLRTRGILALSEAVTILVPIAQAIDRMHAEGVAHGSISVSTIRFTERGSPTLVSFGLAELLDPGLPEVRLASIPGVAADRDALASVADAVLGRIGAADAVSAERLLQRVRLAAPALRSGVLVEGLFELSDGAPVSFDVDVEAGPPAVTPDTVRAARLGTARVGSVQREPEPRRSGGIAGSAYLGVVPDGFVTELLDGRPVRTIARRVRRRAGAQGITPRRLTMGRRIWVALGAGAVTAAVVWIAVPAPQGSDASPGIPVSAANGDPVASSGLSEPEPTATAIVDAEAEAEAEVVAGDDPASAASVLLAARAVCLRDLDAECLGDIDQEGSALRRSDVEWIRMTTAGEQASDPLGIEPGEVGAVQSLGDSAVLQVGGATPASLLMMKSEAGWRLRELVAVAS